MRKRSWCHRRPQLVQEDWYWLLHLRTGSTISPDHFWSGQRLPIYQPDKTCFRSHRQLALSFRKEGSFRLKEGCLGCGKWCCCGYRLFDRELCEDIRLWSSQTRWRHRCRCRSESLEEQASRLALRVAWPPRSPSLAEWAPSLLESGSQTAPSPKALLVQNWLGSQPGSIRSFLSIEWLRVQLRHPGSLVQHCLQFCSSSFSQCCLGLSFDWVLRWGSQLLWWVQVLFLHLL